MAFKYSSLAAILLAVATTPADAAAFCMPRNNRSSAVYELKTGRCPPGSIELTQEEFQKRPRFVLSLEERFQELERRIWDLENKGGLK